MKRRIKTLGRLHHSGLFWRFILIGIAVLMPLTGALVQLAGEERERAVKATRERAELLITYAVESQNHVVGGQGGPALSCRDPGSARRRCGMQPVPEAS